MYHSHSKYFQSTTMIEQVKQTKQHYSVKFLLTSLELKLPHSYHRHLQEYIYYRVDLVIFLKITWGGGGAYDSYI